MKHSALFTNALAAAALALCAACSYNPDDYSCFSDIDPVEGWRYGSTFVYMPQVADSVVHGRLELLVKHTNDYPYANLWLELESQKVNSKGHLEVVRDTICVELADKFGNWHGSGPGTSFQFTHPVDSNYTLINQAPLKLRHIMRPQSVTGIEKVGLIFTSDSHE